ncbi:MAG: LysE family translocator [Casimicrobiaceae bacterium]
MSALVAFIHHLAARTAFAMHDFVPAFPLFVAFLVASFVLAVTPGPGVFYIVARSLTQGRLSGLASVAGVALGNMGNSIGASLGLAALFAMSSLAFTVAKYLGALYLIYLGVQALRGSRQPASDANSMGAPLPAAALRRTFIDGFIVALLNPKTALFFAAFLPQFIDTAHAPMAQTITLGTIFVLMAALTDSIYALTAGAVRPWLQPAKGVETAGRYLTGGAFIGLGILAAFSGQRAKP